MPESEFLGHRKKMTDNIVNNFEYFKHGNTEESIQVINTEESIKWVYYIPTQSPLIYFSTGGKQKFQLDVSSPCKQPDEFNIKKSRDLIISKIP